MDIARQVCRHLGPFGNPPDKDALLVDKRGRGTMEDAGPEGRETRTAYRQATKKLRCAPKRASGELIPH